MFNMVTSFKTKTPTYYYYMRLFKIQFCLFLFIGTTTIHAQNLLDDAIYGFEEPSKWFIQSKDYWSFTDENVFDGNFSLKFDCDDYSNVSQNIQMHCGAKANAAKREKVILEPGVYKVTAYVWINKTYPKSFGIKFKESENSPFVNLVWKLYSAPKEQWVELAQRLVVEEPINSSMIISVSQNPKFGGPGVFYLDRIMIQKM